MFVIEDNDSTGIDMVFHGGSQNSRIEFCCIDQTDISDCDDLTWENIPQETLSTHKNCVIDGELFQFHYIRMKLPDDAPCGLRYFKFIAYEGTSNERIFYSEPVYVYEDSKRLYKLNINDPCGVGGVNWVDVWQGWPLNDGYEVYLPPLTEVAFVDEVTESTTVDNGDGDQKQVFASVSWRYQFDTEFIPEHYAEIIKEITNTQNNSITFPDRQQDHYVKIADAESAISSDEDGCFVQVNMQFEIKRYVDRVCCNEAPCQCPQDDAMTVISYTTDELDAELVFGNTYIVPDGAAGPNNPAWSAHQNEIAIWNGSGWDFSTSPVRTIAYVEDEENYYISIGGGGTWSDNLMIITNATYNGAGTCTWTVEGVIPNLTWGKLQWSVSGSGVWNDADGVYEDADAWASGVEVYLPAINNYDLRIVPLDIGCDLVNSEEYGISQTESCI